MELVQDLMTKVDTYGNEYVDFNTVQIWSKSTTLADIQSGIDILEHVATIQGATNVYSIEHRETCRIVSKDVGRVLPAKLI